MFFDDEEPKPSAPIPQVTIKVLPGKPPRPDDSGVKLVQGGGKESEDDEKDQKRLEPCDVTGDDEELVDPQTRLKECCVRSEECHKLLKTLQECNERVSSKEKTLETCEMELYDFVHCVDHCVAKDLFHYLK